MAQPKCQSLANRSVLHDVLPTAQGMAIARVDNVVACMLGEVQAANYQTNLFTNVIVVRWRPTEDQLAGVHFEGAT